LYRGSEVGIADKAIVRVYRPEDQVFKADSMHSFAHKPVTDDHPKVMVTADTWKDVAVGTLGGQVARDGEFIRVDLAVMDGKTIKKIQDGKAELSVGYGCNIVIGDGTTPSGEKYDAMQTDIVVNHLAVVDAARGGSLLRIGDSGKGVDQVAFFDAFKAIKEGKVNKDEELVEATAFMAADKAYPIVKNGTVYVRGLEAAKVLAVAAKDVGIIDALESLLQLVETGAIKDSPTIEKDVPPMTTLKTHTIDGVTVEMSDVAQQVVDRHIKTLNDSLASVTAQLTQATDAATAAKKASDEAIAKLTTDNAANVAKIATLEQQVKDAAITPEKLDAMVKDRAAIAVKAKAIIGDKLVVDGKTVNDIRRQVVSEKLGDTAKAWTDEQVAVSFDTMTHTVDTSGVQDTARAFSAPPMGDAAMQSAARYDARDKKLESAWKNPTATKQ
jgi:hypothetical protein